MYSTAYDMTYEAAPLSITSFCENLTRRQTLREVLEIGVVAEAILALSAKCGTVSVSREGGMAVLRTGVTVRAMYLDEGGVPLVAERSIDAGCQLELPEDCRITARAICTEEVQGTLGDRGIEVRFPVDFHVEAAARVKKGLCLRRKAGYGEYQGPGRCAFFGSAVHRAAGKRLGFGEKV